MDSFLTEPQRANVERWKTNSGLIDNSISTKVLTPFWDRVAQLVPDEVAPNVLSLAGALCLLHAWYVSHLYLEEHPQAVSALVFLLMFAYQTLDAIDGRHARRIRNDSPLGELFDNVCDMVGSVFLVLAVCNLLGMTPPSQGDPASASTNVRLVWYLVQSAQLVFLWEHLGAFRTGVVRYSLFGGPGEALFLFMVVSLVRGTIGLDWLHHPLLQTVRLEQVVLTVYVALNVLVLIETLRLPSSNYATRNGLLFCLIYRALFPSIALYLSSSSAPSTTIEELEILPQQLVASSSSYLWPIICDGLFMTVVTSDIILGKMAKRDLHPWIVVFAMLSIFHHLATILLVAFYYFSVFSDLAQHLQLPFLTVHRNVYCSGVFDLCHLGHMKLFENAAKMGTRLFVGVCNDADVTRYKRKPIMNEKERYAAVAACKFVHKVIPDAPCFDLPVEFLIKHKIHVVALSEEYNHPDDKFYAGARDLGIDKVLPRTDGISTSDLLARIRAYSSKSS
ncbi:Choline/ethanolamine phosphotransferase (CEPT) [Balamuthia mandrillaris]